MIRSYLELRCHESIVDYIHKESEMRTDVWTTYIAINATVGDEPLRMIVRNDCLNYEYVRQVVINWCEQTKSREAKNALAIVNNWNPKDNFLNGTYPVYVADVEIGHIVLKAKRQPCIYGARILSKTTRYRCTLRLESSCVDWECCIDAKPYVNVNVMFREAAKHLKPGCFSKEKTEDLKKIAELIPGKGWGGPLFYAGTKVGSFSIGETYEC